MRCTETEVLPVIAVSPGTISKSFRKYLGNVPVDHEVKKLQTAAILSTAYLARKVVK